MPIIIDKIKLKSTAHRAQFEQWVTDTDYVACHDLQTVKRFVVSKVHNLDYDYVEVVSVTSLAEFELETHTPLFQSLVERFTQMADVVETIHADELMPGYQW
ncbi:RedY protein [Pseudoalteromonas sp. MMG013]|uniref:RedY protein n=1 Tax=unclassified Pseudoalteromonas TaxID=194690 RepID=UPI001B367367|nr:MULTISPECIES: RedY protein [unclassified Pseudoalteromonas]MBQ4844622.1 RedY protein [Pseudoalteromonas sp. MMG005]MBQ4850436.1 RedY protein [Pseudoalteromonas sp. MMG012]MBQ4863662.1 RedY protein [Pseudoalteromonas sp. MMG013]